MQVQDIVRRILDASLTREGVGPDHFPMLVRKAEIFFEALTGTKKGSFLEIGVQHGDVSLICIEVMIEASDFRVSQTVDPFMETGYLDVYLYAMNKLLPLANTLHIISGNPSIWKHFSVTDYVYMENVYPSLPQEYKEYFFIHLDGPHDFDSVIKEYHFFKNKLVPGGIIIIDDVGVNDSIGATILKEWEGTVETITNGIVLRK